MFREYQDRWEIPSKTVQPALNYWKLPPRSTLDKINKNYMIQYMEGGGGHNVCSSLNQDFIFGNIFEHLEVEYNCVIQSYYRWSRAQLVLVLSDHNLKKMEQMIITIFSLNI